MLTPQLSAAFYKQSNLAIVYQSVVNFLAVFQSVFNINYLLNSKHLLIVNLLLFLIKFTITWFDCTSNLEH